MYNSYNSYKVHLSSMAYSQTCLMSEQSPQGILNAWLYQLRYQIIEYLTNLHNVVPWSNTKTPQDYSDQHFPQ